MRSQVHGAHLRLQVDPDGRNPTATCQQPDGQRGAHDGSVEKARAQRGISPRDTQSSPTSEGTAGALRKSR